MKQELREKLPTWYKDLEDCKLVLTNDLDSLLGCYLLNKYFGCEIKSFYDFNSIYFAKDTEKKNFIGVDLDTIKGKTIGNHMVWYKNEDSINLNNHINVKYYKKYPFNTVMLILSLYDIDITQWTDEQLKVLLSIDSAYTGYYADSQHFVDVYTDWLDKLDFRFLEDRILKDMTPAKFSREVKAKYYTNFTIRINKDGYLETDIDLDSLSKLFNDIIELPKDKFFLERSFTYEKINPMKEIVPDKENIFSLAWIYKNTLKMSLK